MEVLEGNDYLINAIIPFTYVYGECVIVIKAIEIKGSSRLRSSYLAFLVFRPPVIMDATAYRSQSNFGIGYIGYNWPHSEMNGGAVCAELGEKFNLDCVFILHGIRLRGRHIFVFGGRSSRNSGGQS